jgi:predicted metal-dependent phosphoesterase TrpH
LSNTSLKKLLAEFRGLGGDGLEVACSNMKQDGVESLARLGEELGLLASVGSDFHTATATWMDLGRLPTLPERVKKNAIWSHDRWHSLAG